MREAGENSYFYPGFPAQKPPPWEQSITRYISTFSLKSLSPWKSQAINNPLIPLSGPNSFLFPAPPFPACPHSRGGASTECLPLTSQAHISELRQELPCCWGAPGTRSPPPPARCEAKLCEGKEKFCCSGRWGASLHSTSAGNPRTPRGFGDFCSEKPTSISHFCTALAFAGEY